MKCTNYPGPNSLKAEANRAVILGEFGGVRTAAAGGIRGQEKGDYWGITAACRRQGRKGEVTAA